MHTDEQRTARQREIVTCPRDNGINKAGWVSRLVPRPSSHCVVLTSQKSTSLVYYVCSVSRIVRRERKVLRLSIQYLPNGGDRED